MHGPPGSEPSDGRKSDLLNAVIDVAMFEMEEWGTGGLGIQLCCRVFSGEPCARPKELAKNSPLSAGQIRRRLESLCDDGLVERGMVDGYVCYWANREAAERLWQEIVRRLTLQNATGVSSSNRPR